MAKKIIYKKNNCKFYKIYLGAIAERKQPNETEVFAVRIIIRRQIKNLSRSLFKLQSQ